MRIFSLTVPLVVMCVALASSLDVEPTHTTADSKYAVFGFLWGE